MIVISCLDVSTESWLPLRHALWPEASLAEHREEIEALGNDASETVAFVAIDGQAAVGFSEVSLRRDYVNGCESSPVAFLEGIYVRPDYRRRGTARLLNKAAEDWARAQGCAEYASDTDLANTIGQALHISLGFEETERVIFFRKKV